MKRDLALCVSIMAFAEENCSGGLTTVNVEGVDRGVVNGHVQLLKDAGLLEADFTQHVGGTMGNNHWQVRRLTWAGHDWLDAHRPKQSARRKLVAAKPEPEPDPPLSPGFKAAGVRRVTLHGGAGEWEQPQ